MTTENDVIVALEKVAERLLERPISTTERSRLIRVFTGQQGTDKERARKALIEITGHSERLLLEKSAASDNTRRLITDLDSAITNWKK